ncbi:RHS repeat-associated core domain-containing protein [Pseudomonas sp. CDFA 610]|nr:RHS repeat-associated core domain-containing protein [Pseudomonas sp. CDFA 610]
MTLLCTYTYDPLDRIATLSPLAQALTQRFYCNGRMTTERQGGLQRTLFQADTHLLAQLNREDSEGSIDLIATDQQNSALGVITAAQQIDIAYSPYGHRDPDLSGTALPGFTGAQPEQVTGHYLLGNGYRAFNPTLMRFNSPDSLSPFGKGGFNAYAYCAGNPINRIDPTGHMSFTSLGAIASLILMAGGIASTVVGSVTTESNPKISTPLIIVGILTTVLGTTGLSASAGAAIGRRAHLGRPEGLAGRQSRGAAPATPGRMNDFVPDNGALQGHRNGISAPSGPSLEDRFRAYLTNQRVSAAQGDRPPAYEPPPSYDEAIGRPARLIVSSSDQIRSDPIRRSMPGLRETTA